MGGHAGAIISVGAMIGVSLGDELGISELLGEVGELLGISEISWGATVGGISGGLGATAPGQNCSDGSPISVCRTQHET